MRPHLIMLATAAIGFAQGTARLIPPHPKASPASVRAGAPRLDPAAVNNPSAAMPVGSGSSAVRAQILLDRAGFSSGEIDGTLGRNTLHALAAFQQAHDLKSSGRMDRATWTALNADASPPLIPYTITEADLKGPFVTIPADMMEKAKLDHMGYSSPLEELAEKFHCSPQLLRSLNPKATFETAGEELMAPAVRAPRQAHAAKIVVSKLGSTVSAFDAHGKLIAQYPSSSGSEHDPLPLGTWKVTGVIRNPPFDYNPDLFWDANAAQAKAVIAPGPNNPVGMVWIHISKPHYGIHGTPEPSAVGHTQSHGCIRLTNWDALELAGMVMPGIPAILTE
jgi:lipoprotein-anchoring transpeptidase ErfK/SrfK